MDSVVFLQILQRVVVIAVAALDSGIQARAEAIVASKRGPSVVGPYRDLATWLRKSRTTCAQALWEFRDGPFVALACCLAVLPVHPIITNEPLPLAFLAEMHRRCVCAHPRLVYDLAIRFGAACPLGGLAASRASWIGSLAEPALILVFYTVDARSASGNRHLMNQVWSIHPYVLVLPTPREQLLTHLLLRESPRREGLS